MEKRLTGRIAPERIRLMTTPRPPDGAVERFLVIGDPTGLVSDAMDELGIAHGGIKDAHYGSGVSFRDPDGIALEFFAPPA